jgi:hypothetical protein
VKCAACGKEILGDGVVISCDGDFVCDSRCRHEFDQQIACLIKMTEVEFEEWLTSSER